MHSSSSDADAMKQVEKPQGFSQDMDILKEFGRKEKEVQEAISELKGTED